MMPSTSFTIGKAVTTKEARKGAQSIAVELSCSCILSSSPGFKNFFAAKEWP